MNFHFLKLDFGRSEGTYLFMQSNYQDDNINLQFYNNTGKYENPFIKTGNNLNKPFVGNFQAKVGQQETVA